MADNFKANLVKKWAGMSQSQRTMLAVVAILFTTIAIGSLFVKDIKPVQKPQAVSGSDLTFPGASRNLTNEALAAKLDALAASQKEIMDFQTKSQNDVTSLKSQLSSIKQEQSQAPSANVQPATTVTTKPAPSQIDPIADPSLNLPVDQIPNSVDTATSKPTPSAVPIRVISSPASADEKDASDDEKNIQPYLPIGSMFDAVFINGLDAPTSQVSMKTPVPSLLRVKTDAILPNEYRKDVRECFVIVSGFGVLSTERAQLRTENISCVRKDGGVIEAVMNGYVVGEDGKVGVRGRLVSKQGQLIAQSLLVGFVQGIGNAMQPMSVPAYNLNPGNTSTYQMPNPSMMAMSGLASGVSNAANTVAKFYMTLASQMFPIIEVDAGRKVTIILTKGMQFDLSGKYKLTQAADSSQASPPANAGSTNSPNNGETVSMRPNMLPAMPVDSTNTSMPQGISPQ